RGRRHNDWVFYQQGTREDRFSHESLAKTQRSRAVQLVSVVCFGNRNPEVMPMIVTLVQKVVGSKTPAQPMALKRVLERLDITPFTPESVAQYKREKLEQVESELHPDNAEEVKEHDFRHWEYSEFQWLYRKFAKLAGDKPVIRVWKTGESLLYTYL